MQVLKPEIRQEILDAAKELFYAHGYTAATMRQVAERVSMSVSNLYKYFRNKDDLFEAVVGAYASELERGLAMELEHDREEEFERRRIEKMVEGFAGAINKDPKLFCILMNRSQGSPYRNFKKDCVDLLKNHVLSASERSSEMEFATGLVSSNLFTAFAEIASAFGGSDRVRRELAVIFRYHMAGFKALRG